MVINTYGYGIIYVVLCDLQSISVVCSCWFLYFSGLGFKIFCSQVMDNDNKSYGYFYTDGSVSFLFYMFALFLCLMMVVCSFGWRPTHGCLLTESEPNFRYGCWWFEEFLVVMLLNSSSDKEASTTRISTFLNGLKNTTPTFFANLTKIRNDN